MGEFAPLNPETVTREPDDQTFDTRHRFTAIAHGCESDLNIGQQFGLQSCRDPSPADADVADSTEPP